MLITLDIETLPTEDVEAIATIAAGISHPKTMSKAETIAKWEAEEKPGVVAEAVAKTGLDGSYGRILCIGWAVDDSEPQTIIGAEIDVLQGFMDAIAIRMPQDRFDHSAVFIGHNIGAFDLRFIWQRCVVNQVKINPTLLAACRAKPWDKCIADTLLLWNPDNQRRISLDKLCKVLGVPTSKGDFDGTKIWQAFKDGRIKEISDYCAEDVRATRECYLRMTFA